MSLAARVKRLERAGKGSAQEQPGLGDSSRYATDPVLYATERLRVSLTPDQQQILRCLLIPPCRVDVPSGNSTGKSFVGAVAISWWFDTFNPGAVYSTAPRYEHVVNVLWKQLRILRARAGLPTPYIGPRAPEIYDSPDHFAVGITANRGESFQGRHIGRKLFVFDEATGLPPIYYETLRTMFDPETGDACLIIYNPTDTTSAAYQEDLAAQESEELVWHRIRLNALEHPNVLAELRGDKRPIPGAVNLKMVNEWIRDWAEPLQPGDTPRATDLEWPPSAVTGRPGKWYRPGPVLQARGLGLWPQKGKGIWTDSLFAACLREPAPDFPQDVLPCVGCDTATGQGQDFMAIHARWGNRSWHHETSNTMDAVTIAGRLREVCQEAARRVNAVRPAEAHPVRPEQIPIRIDDDGVGRAIAAMLARDKYNVTPIGAGTTASAPARYPRRRDELWFQVAAKAEQGGVWLGDLPRADQRRLKAQLMAPEWHLDNQGRRQVEPKDDTREKIGRSPDDADALNLAYLEGAGFTPPPLAPPPERRPIFPEAQPRRRVEREEPRGPFRR
jgi:hypothetical protein